MANPVITIIGLGLTGTSLGLALKREQGNYEVVGHDKDPAAASAATKQAAVDRSAWNLFRACEGAEMIVLATPLNEMEEILKLISEEVRTGCLVLAIAKVMQPAMSLGEKYLPDSVHFVVGHPILSGVGGMLTARSDLFEDIPFCLSTSTETDTTAFQLASDFVERAGAKPLFMDVSEHDGLIAAVEQLPQFLGAVLLQSISDSRAWVEGRRLAGRPFAQSTELLSGPEGLFHDLMSNRDNLITRIDQLQQSLLEWRKLLATDSVADPDREGGGEDEHPLLVALREAWRAREIWETQAILKDWDMVPQLEAPSSGGFMQQMFFGNLFRGRGVSDREREQK